MVNQSLFDSGIPAAIGVALILAAFAAWCYLVFSLPREVAAEVVKPQRKWTDCMGMLDDINEIERIKSRLCELEFRLLKSHGCPQGSCDADDLIDFVWSPTTTYKEASMRIYRRKWAAGETQSTSSNQLHSERVNQWGK